jgi:hypothetical protein
MNMIEVKMSFSSPAEAAAFFAHHAIAQAQGSSATAKVEPPKEQAKTKPADKPSASADKQTSTPSTESQSKAASPATSSADAEAPKVTYPELQQAVMKVVALGDAGKAELKRILAGFNLGTFKGSDEAIWPEALKQVNAAHEALAAA